MLKREMRVNFKSFIMWLIIPIGLLLVVLLMYPSIITSDSVKMLDELMEVFPAEVLKAFNMDISSIDSVYGWLKSEGFVFILLIIGCYSGMLGANILLKEENDKTVEYLNSLPITRTRIVLEKAIVGLVYIVLMIFAIGLFSFVGLSLSGDFDKKQYILLSITPLFPAICIYFVCMFFSTFANKTKKMIGLSLGIVLISYVLQTLSTLADTTEFLKYFSVFTLADVRNVIVDVAINPVMIIISICISAVFFLLALIRYNKKELLV